MGSCGLVCARLRHVAPCPSLTAELQPYLWCVASFMASSPTMQAAASTLPLEASSVAAPPGLGAEYTSADTTPTAMVMPTLTPEALLFSPPPHPTPPAGCPTGVVAPSLAAPVVPDPGAAPPLPSGIQCLDTQVWQTAGWMVYMQQAMHHRALPPSPSIGASYPACPVFVEAPAVTSGSFSSPARVGPTVSPGAPRGPGSSSSTWRPGASGTTFPTAVAFAPLWDPTARHVSPSVLQAASGILSRVRAALLGWTSVCRVARGAVRLASTPFWSFVNRHFLRVTHPLCPPRLCQHTPSLSSPRSTAPRGRGRSLCHGRLFLTRWQPPSASVGC